jgi:plasmid maintenance system killer protein
VGEDAHTTAGLETGATDCFFVKGVREEVFSMWVSGNWRLTFSFNGDAFTLLNDEDYHGK